jgi:hypothetical protein
MLLKKSILALAICSAVGLTAPAYVCAQAIQATGKTEVDVKGFKDLLAARAAGRKVAERDAIKAALKLKLNIDASNPKVEAALEDFVKNFANNLKSTFRTESDILTVTTVLSVDSAELVDMARSLGLQDTNVMESASVVFIIDEYWGIATHLDPSQPLVSETEVFQDKSSFSDTSAQASSSSFSDTSAKGSKSASDSSSLSASSKESSALAASSKQSQAMAASSKESSAIAASEKSAVNASSASAVKGSDSVAIAVQGQSGSAAGSRQTQVSGAQSQNLAASKSTAVAASAASDNRVAASSASDSRVAASSASDQRLTTASSSASASSFDKQNVNAQSSSSDVKNIQQQKDVTIVKTKTVFPDVSNAKPSDAQAAMISQRLAQVVKQYGIEYTPERDLRETGKGKMLIAEIEAQRRWDEYTAKVGKNPFNAKFVVYGTSVMNAEGKSDSGQTICTGTLKLESFSVDTGRGLVSATLNKGAQGTSDQNCRSNLSTALATELAQTIGNAATRELQLVATQGKSYTVTLFSLTAISRRVGGPFEDLLKSIGNVRDDKRTDSARVYTVSYKGADFARRLEKVLDDMGDAGKAGEVANRGNRYVVCLEGKCPSEY